MIILAPALGRVLFLLPCAYRDVYLCYIRTTRTHTHTHTLNESGHVQSPTTLECFFSSLTARPPCLAALLVLLLPHVPTTTTNQNKQTRHSKAQDSRQAGEQEDRKSTSLAYFSFPTSSFYAG
jgi:hypothetical protein